MLLFLFFDALSIIKKIWLPSFYQRTKRKMDSKHTKQPKLLNFLTCKSKDLFFCDLLNWTCKLWNDFPGSIKICEGTVMSFITNVSDCSGNQTRDKLSWNGTSCSSVLVRKFGWRTETYIKSLRKSDQALSHKAQPI